MSLQIYIDNTLIPDEDILKYPDGTEAISYDDFQVIPDNLSVTIDNTDKNIYDDRYDGSMFYAGSIINSDFEIYDDIKEEYIFRARVKDIRTTDSDNKITIEATSYISDLSNIDCIYNNMSDKTPARIIYEILINCGNVPEENIVYSGFQHAINIQNENSLYCDVIYNEEYIIDCMTVINELQRVGHCVIVPILNMIYMIVLEEYDGKIGYEISRILPKSYSHYYSIDAPIKMKNSYRVCYNNSGTIAQVEGSDTTSIAAYGELKFLVPDEEIDDSDTTNFNILIRNSTGATWCGDHAITLRKYLMKLCEFKTTLEYDHIHVGDQMDLRFDNFYGEPCLVLERESNSNNREIKFKGLFLNTPHERYARDTIAPDTIQLYSVVSHYGGVTIKFTEDLSADHIGYKIYFTTTPGEWFSEYCNKGQSPIDYKRSIYSPDGFIYYVIENLNPGSKYYFKVTAYDNSFNESAPSNIVSCCLPSEESNKYYCTGNINLDGVVPDINNTESGTLPSDYSEFPYLFPHIFINPCSILSSGIFYNNTCFTSISFEVSGDVGLQYMISVNNITWSAWISGGFTSTTIYLASNVYYLKYRFLFYPDNWYDDCYAYIKNII